MAELSVDFTLVAGTSEDNLLVPTASVGCVTEVLVTGILVVGGRVTVVL